MGVTEELEALWADVFGEPPPIRARPWELTMALVGALPPAPAYTPRPLAAGLDVSALRYLGPPPKGSPGRPR